MAPTDLRCRVGTVNSVDEKRVTGAGEGKRGYGAIVISICAEPAVDSRMRKRIVRTIFGVGHERMRANVVMLNVQRGLTGEAGIQLRAARSA